MIHGHLPFLISRLGMVLRHVSHFYHSATRMVEVGFYSIRLPSRRTDRPRRSPLPGGVSRGRRRDGSFPVWPLLIHYHIFKNAGTSFEWALRKVFARGLHTYDGAASDAVLSPTQVADYATFQTNVVAIISHQAVLPPPEMNNRRVISSILIRDPIARIRSIYAFERHQSLETRGAQKAKELDFKDYVEWRLCCSRGMFCNYQVYFCSRDNATPHDEELSVAHLQRAIANLEQIDIVGTVERYVEWLSLAQAILAEQFLGLSLDVAHENASSKSIGVTEKGIVDTLVDELGADLAERLLQCNHLDMCLHQVANTFLSRKLAERGPNSKFRRNKGRSFSLSSRA